MGWPRDGGAADRLAPTLTAGDTGQSSARISPTDDELNSLTVAVRAQHSLGGAQ